MAINSSYDVIIVGGGIVGASLALILAKFALRVAVVEALPIRSQKSAADRTLVLAESSKVILNSAELWEKIASDACPIMSIHVSDQGHFGGSKILAEDEGLSSLGYVLSAGLIQRVFEEAVNEQPLITLYQPARFRSLQVHSDHIAITVEKEAQPLQLQAKLLVAADGQRSPVRQFLQVKSHSHSYGQTAILCNVNLKRPHYGVAYERFTHEGPLAMLPCLEQQSAVVWTVASERSKQLLALSNADFITHLQASFGYRLGKLIGCSQRAAVDLELIIAQRQIFPRTVLLGNAVHTLHPVAGQGLNLAFRDVAMLAEQIHLNYQQGRGVGDFEMLERYLANRRADQRQIINLTHSLIKTFSNSLLPLIMARSLGMMLLDRVGSLKKILTRRTLGFSGRISRLACGLNFD